MDIERYEVREIEVPEPMDEAQIVRQVLGLSEPSSVPRRTRRVLQITLSAAEPFPTNETFRGISIGRQQLSALAISPDGKQATGIVDALPSDGERIVLHAPTSEGPTLLAGVFDTSKLDRRFA